MTNSSSGFWVIGPACSARGSMKTEMIAENFMRPTWHRNSWDLLPVGSNFIKVKPRVASTQKAHLSILRTSLACYLANGPLPDYTGSSGLNWFLASLKNSFNFK